ncbi:hypothetical protein [Candidatus Amarolinea dominans]|uniref:hypothetical protein n=1 Tax=Candidatus Amarolinea dominans TaxID=3140696 RepID=UPI00313731F6|nr:hypothetical protein [Anaerolineae bacterium]
MNHSLDRETSRLNPALVWLAVVGIALVGLMAMSNTLLVELTASAPASVAQASLAPGTEGLLRQTASHLSKLLGGASVGGFPGFEPPGDDDKYRRKIEKRSYTAEEVNYWVKEINNFLGQIVKKNPGMSLEEILQKQGLNPEQIVAFIRALRNIHSITAGMESIGVSGTTTAALAGLMNTLGVSPW